MEWKKVLVEKEENKNNYILTNNVIIEKKKNNFASTYICVQSYFAIARPAKNWDPGILDPEEHFLKSIN